MAAIDSPAPGGHKEKRSKKDKKEKKRSREEDAEGEERRHKRSKSVVSNTHDDENNDDEISPAGSQDLSHADLASASASANGEPSPEKKRKHKKDKSRKSIGDADADAVASDAEQPKEKKEKKKKRKSQGPEEPAAEDDAEPATQKKEKKKSKKAKAPPSPSPSPEPTTATADDENEDEEADADAMDVDSPVKTKSTSRVHQPPDAPSKPQFPFYTQTVSLYLPIYPAGWDTPCTAAAEQHLEPLVNRYVPELKGVLLAFRNVALSEQPGRRGAATSDGERCDLVSVDEYAVGFGYVTFDADLFVPRRGAWMEGSINLENEGHIGVVCWGKFNASIESARLPPEWRWVHAGSAEAAEYVEDPFAEGEEAAEANEADAEAKAADDEHGAVRQIHTTGFWVGGDGEKVKGRVRFRIKAFDVGVSGDHGYLSLEGTMLGAAGERAAVERDAEQERRRRAGKSGGILSKERRRMPEFSVTKFSVVEDEEEKALRQDVWNTTAPEPEGGAAEGDKEEAFTGISAEAD
ncbi:RNA polymerase Rpb7-like domain-containing protein [Colletotrichum musicola]|uniref:DNA-directed RNA polymerase subunit n=1 Tax=Colletotrichum musicola TaxID=2175873 RepID=A0A8H6NVI5_9PEZI|nr:RNA polymerase Rpb7-like domain-containing protein [Colletotrichum musicola]